MVPVVTPHIVGEKKRQSRRFYSSAGGFAVYSTPTILERNGPQRQLPQLREFAAIRCASICPKKQ
jgi:hypothetical protein